MTLRAVGGRHEGRVGGRPQAWLQRPGRLPDGQPHRRGCLRQPHARRRPGDLVLRRGGPRPKASRGMRCLACGTARSLLDSEERWTYPPTWCLPQCSAVDRRGRLRACTWRTTDSRDLGRARRALRRLRRPQRRRRLRRAQRQPSTRSPPRSEPTPCTARASLGDTARVRLVLVADTHVPKRARDLPRAGLGRDRRRRRRRACRRLGRRRPARRDSSSARAGWSASSATTTARAAGAAARDRPRRPRRVRVTVVHETGRSRQPGAPDGRTVRRRHDVLVFGHSHIPWDTQTDAACACSTRALRLTGAGSRSRPT